MTALRVRTEGYVPELDGVRALAVWMVLLTHIVDGWSVPKGTFDAIPSFIMQILHHGWLGVDLFFVLSGYLITGILLDTREQPRYFQNFYGRRFLRIFPLYFAVIAVCYFLYPSAGQYFLISLCFLANFSYAFGISVPHGPGVFWSLAVEEHFYLIWPCITRLLGRKKLAITCILLICFIPLLRLWAKSRGMDLVNEIYSYTWFRVDGLALGAFLAIWVRSSYGTRRQSLQLSAGLAAASILLTLIGLPLGIMSTGSVLRYTQVQLCFAAFLLAAVSLQGSFATAPLRSSFARVSGDLSYCLYLIHLTVGDGFQALAIRIGWRPESTFSPLGVVLVRGMFILAVSFTLAWLSRRFLELPILKLKRYFEYHRPKAVQQATQTSSSLLSGHSGSLT